MIRKISIGILFYFIAFSLHASSADPELLKKIVEQLEKNEEIISSYDFHNDAEIKDVDKEGKVEKAEKFTYRTISLEGYRYFELIKFNDKELDKEKKKEEAKRREKFLKKIKKGDTEDEDEITWKDLVDKFEFTTHPSEGEAAYVISFKPRDGEQKERNRTEKIVNRLAGKFWVTSDYNIIKASGHLTSSVKYGLGVLANVEKLQIDYAQTRVDGVWLPDTFNLHYIARVFVKMRNREIQNRYYKPTKRPTDATGSSAELK
jgi:hypothetical protein